MFEAAPALFDALAANQPIQLTGSTSDGYGTAVVGEADQATTAPTATPDPTATDAVVPDAGATEAPVVLPPTITGQTAKQVTCTQAQR